MLPFFVYYSNSMDIFIKKQLNFVISENLNYI
jgi:hypothetical protein